MSTYCLEVRSTQNWDDVRYREYTTSKRKADAFRTVPKVQFSDSGHGLIPVVKEHAGPRQARIHTLSDHVHPHVRAALACKPPAPATKLHAAEADAGRARFVAARKRYIEWIADLVSLCPANDSPADSEAETLRALDVIRKDVEARS